MGICSYANHVSCTHDAIDDIILNKFYGNISLIEDRLIISIFGAVLNTLIFFLCDLIF